MLSTERIQCDIGRMEYSRFFLDVIILLRLFCTLKPETVKTFYNLKKIFKTKITETFKNLKM